MNNSKDKATLQWRSVTGVDPRDPAQKIIRPLIVGTEKYDTARVLRFCMENGYIHGGQYFSNYGVINGFLEGCQRLGLDGRCILLDGWLYIHPVLKGTCDPVTRQMADNTEIHVCAQAQKDLRVKANQFRWECIDETAGRSNVQHLQSVGGEKDKEIFSGAKISVGGTNLKFYAATDKITATWQTTSESGEVVDHSVDITPESSGYSQMILPFPTDLATAPVGTVVTFTFLFRKGDEKATVIPAVAKANVIAAPNVG